VGLRLPQINCEKSEISEISPGRFLNVKTALSRARLGAPCLVEA
jgi:hypothetical protein